MFRTVKLFVVSVVFTLVLGEILVRLFIPVRNVGPSFSEFDSLYGKHLKKNFTCERITPEFRMRFSTNSLGFREPEPSSFPERGILFLGDSFTEGYGVNDGEEFPDLIRDALVGRQGNDAIPVINAGIGNHGNGRWIKFLNHEGKRYNPRLIILQLSDNDFYDNLREGLFTLTPNDSLNAHPPPPSGSLRYFQKLIDAVPGLPYSYLVSFVREAISFSASAQQLPPSEEELRRRERLTYRLVEEILTICHREGWPAIILYADYEEARFKNMELTVAKFEVPNIRIPLRTERPELFYTIDGHWNAKGHEFVALQVLEQLKQREFFVNK